MIGAYGEADAHGLWGTPAAERNKEPILAVLRDTLPVRGTVLEVASGTGQHVVHFARALPALTWLPSDPEPELRRAMEDRIRREALGNVRPPLDLDVLRHPWPVGEVDAVLCINMIHVAPWAAAGALVRGCGEVLPDDGVLFLYGPYRRFGAHTAPSNEAFDAQLRARNPEWGVRELEEVEQLAGDAGLRLDAIVDMPANNFSLVLRRTGHP